MIGCFAFFKLWPTKPDILIIFTAVIDQFNGYVCICSAFGNFKSAGDACPAALTDGVFLCHHFDVCSIVCDDYAICFDLENCLGCCIKGVRSSIYRCGVSLVALKRDRLGYLTVRLYQGCRYTKQAASVLILLISCNGIDFVPCGCFAERSETVDNNALQFRDISRLIDRDRIKLDELCMSQLIKYADYIAGSVELVNQFLTIIRVCIRYGSYRSR